MTHHSEELVPADFSHYPGFHDTHAGRKCKGHGEAADEIALGNTFFSIGAL